MPFRSLTTQRLRRSDHVRWAPGWLAKHPAMARRCDPEWAEITNAGWLGFQRTRASDWDQYEFRRPVKDRMSGAMGGRNSQPMAVSLTAKIDALSPRAKAWLHCACDQMADAGEYIDNPDARRECAAAGILTEGPRGIVEMADGVMPLVYSDGYLRAFATR